jgi:hypothetical protein
LLSARERSFYVLILSRSGHFSFPGQVRQKLRHLGFSHMCRMAFLVEKNESLDPIRVGLFGPDRIMREPNRVANSVEQFTIV